MKSYLSKMLLFVVIMGGLLLIGLNQMKMRGIDGKSLSASDIEHIYNHEEIIKDVDYIEIQTSNNAADNANANSNTTTATAESTENNIVKVDDKNKVSYLTVELNNNIEIDEKDADRIDSYANCPLVIISQKDGGKYYVKIGNYENNSNKFIVAKDPDFSDKAYYQTLSGDDIYEYVLGLYNHTED